jgi:hypothetical protein
MAGMIKTNNTHPSGHEALPPGQKPLWGGAWAGGLERVGFKAPSFLTGFTNGFYGRGEIGMKVLHKKVNDLEGVG